MPPPDAATTCYFRSMCGNWQGIYHFTVTDRVAMRKAVPAMLDRFRLLTFHGWGRFRISTRVKFLAENQVQHTTDIMMLGIPTFHSTELFDLREDGCTLAVRMQQRLAPTIWHRREFTSGEGVIDDPTVGADYRLPWIGGVICQRTRIVTDGVELRQSTAWFQSEALLVRSTR